MAFNYKNLATFKNACGYSFDDTALTQERLTSLCQCRDMAVENSHTTAVWWCDHHSLYHTSSHYPMAEIVVQIYALKKRLSYLKEVENKLYNIIYYYYKSNSLSTLDQNIKNHSYCKKHQFRARMLIEHVKILYLRKIELENKLRLRRERNFIKKTEAFLWYDHTDVDLGRFDFNFKCLSKHVRRSKKSTDLRSKSLDFSNVSYNLQKPYEEVINKINVELKGRIRDIVDLYRLSRNKGVIPNYTFISPRNMFYIKHALHKFIYYDILTPISEPQVCVPESEGAKDEKGENVTTTEQGGNVVLAEENPGTPEQVCVHYMPNFWQNVSSNDTKGSYSELTSRYIEVQSFEWSKDNPALFFLVDIDLPKFILSMDTRTVCDRPNTIPFKVNALAKYDLEIKVQINAQKFQIGQLLVCWYYFPQFDLKFTDRWHTTNFSQTIHSLITANVSNEATIRVPYNYYAPYIRTRQRDDMPEPNNMGKLIISIVNPLTVSASGASKCHGTVWCRFVQAEFTGTVSGSFGVAQGIMCKPESVFSNVMEGAVSGLMTSFTDRNRDNPPDPRAPMYLVPTASHSWSAGTGVREPVHSLRLDLRGQKPYLTDNVDEMSVKYVTGKYAYIKTLTVSKDDAAGKLIESFEASPMMDKRHYTTNAGKDNQLPYYCLPPCAVISNLFNYWRGTINFRFDLVYSTIGHNARFLIAYIPGATTNDKPTLADAKSSPHIVISLGETQSYTYPIPFVSHRPFWSRNYTGNFKSEFVQPPSMLYVFLLNPLVPMESVPDKMYINVWMSGGDDFEVSVPIQPNIGLAFNRTVMYANTELIFAQEGYYPYYFGSYYRVQNSRVLVARHAATSGAASVFPTTYSSKATADKAYYYESYDDADMPLYKWTDGAMYRAKWGVIWPTGSSGDFPMILTRTENDAKALALLLAANKATPNFLQKVNQAVIDLCVPATDPGSNTWSHGNPGWDVHEVLRQRVEEWEVIPNANDKNVLTTTERLAGTGFGLMMFGERFYDLKDLCRRYQAYASFTVSVEDLTLGQCSVVLPVMLQGLDLDVGSPKEIKQVANRCRDGHIPIIASGYRVGSGSVRFRMVVPSAKGVGIWVQHRPDRGLRTRKLIPCREIVTAEAVVNHSYASYVQMTHVNGVIEFEIPYYVPGPHVMLQVPGIVKTDDRYFYSLGEISIGFVFDKASYQDLAKELITVYYCLADDARYSIFQGFPPMVLLDDISDVSAVTVEPESPYPESLDPFSENIQYPSTSTSEENCFIEDAIEVKEEGFFSKITDSVLGKATDGLKEKLDEKITPLIDQIEHKVEEFGLQLEEKTGINIVEVPLVRQVLYNIVGIGINPTIKTVLWSIATIMIEIGFLTFSYVQAFTEYLLQFIQYIKAQFASNEPNAEVQPKPCIVRPNGPNEDDSPVVGLLTIMWTALSSVVSYKGRKPKDLKGFASFLGSDMKNVFASSNGLFHLIKNLVTTFKQMYLWIVKRVYPDYGIWTTFSEEYATVKAWCEEVAYLIRPENADDVLINSDMIDRITLAYDQGALFLTPLSKLMSLQDKDANKVVSVVKDMYKKISKLHADCVSMGVDSHIRKVCFTVCMYGTAGIGKSYLMSETCRTLLKGVNYVFRGPMECAVDPTSKFWSQCSRQPVLVMDDMWAVETGQILEQQIIMLNQLFSHVPFTPPMAELSDKKMRYNPEIYWYNTNKPFPVFDRIDKKMLYRRRHMLIKARHIDFTKAEEVKKGCAHCEQKFTPQTTPAEYTHLLNDFHHLRFGIHKNVEDPDEKIECELTYAELTKEMLKRYREHREKETTRFEGELRKYQEMRDGMIFEDEQEEFASKMVKIRTLADSYKQKLMNVHMRDVLTKYANLISHESIVRLTSLYTDYFPNKLTISDHIPGLNTVDDALAYCFSHFKSRKVVPESDNGRSDDEEEYERIRPLPNDLPEILLTELSYKNAERYLREIKSRRAQWSEYVSPFCAHIVNSVFQLYSEGIITGEMFDECALSLTLPCKRNNVDYLTAVLMNVFQLRKKEIISTGPQGETYINKCVGKRKFYSWYDVFCFLGTCVDLPAVLNGVDVQVIRCECWDMETDSVTWSELGWAFQGKVSANLDDCTNENCPMKTWLFKRAFLKQYLLDNPYIMHHYRKGNYSMIPKDYSDGSVSFPDVKTYMFVVKRMLKQVTGMMSKIFIKIWHFLEQYWPIILSFMPLVLVGVGIYMSSPPQPPVLQMKHSWADAESAYSTNLGMAPKAGVKPVVSQSESQQYEVVLKLIRSNFFYLTMVANGKVVTYRCLRLRMNEVLILRHYDDEIKSVGDVAVTYGKCAGLNADTFKYGIQFNYRECKIKWYRNVVVDGCYPSNFGILLLPPCFPMAKDLTKFIATSDDHKYSSGFGSLVEGDKVVEHMRITRDSKRPFVIPKTDIVSPVAMDDVYVYTKHGAGVCGSVLLAANMQRPIIGMHVAGYGTVSGNGLAEILCSEMFSEIVTTDVPVKSMVMPTLDDAKFASIDLETAIYPYGCVTGKFAHAQSSKTQYVQSPIQGVYPVECEPNPLGPNDKRLPKGCNPLSAGIANKGLPPLDFSSDLLDAAAEDLERIILTQVKPTRSQIGVVPLEQAVCGVAGLDGFDMIEMSTSCGYPLSAIKPSGASGKKWLFDLEEVKSGEWRLKGMHDELKRLYTLETEMRKRGVKPFTVFVDCLKDTCLPLEKCRVVGKTRIFSISPVQYTMAFKQYCLDFMSSYQAARFNAEHAIGINPQSLEWTELTSRLLKKSKCIVTGDYKNFGPGLMKICVNKAKNIILSWYKHYGASSEHIKVLDILFSEIIDAYYLGGNLIYQTPCGIPSGSPITAPLNSMVNSLYIRYVYGCLINRDFSKFLDNVFLCTYGDDVVMSVVPEIVDRFNARTMSEVFKDYNITFTDQDKSNNCVEYRDIRTATFLKRDFLPHPVRQGVWIGRLEKRSIQNILNWVHRRGNISDNIKENASMAFQLAVEWGPDYYNDMCRRVAIALSDVGVTCVYNTWKYWDEKNYSSL